MGRNNKILIAGGAGYLGSRLSEMLLDLGFWVTVLDIQWFGDSPISHLQGKDRFKVVKVDLRRLDEVAPHLANMDCVINLAGIVGDPACDIDPLFTHSCNYLATVNLAVLSKHLGVKKYIFASSCSVYGSAKGQILSEDSKTNPVSIYAVDKLESEKALSKLNDTNFHTTSLRLSTLFGFSKRMRYDLVLNKLAAQAAVGETITIHGGSQMRPFVHVDDAAEAFLSVIRCETSLMSGQIFNVGSDEQNISIAAISDLIKCALPNCDISFVHQAVDQRDYHVSFKKIKSILGFKPKVSIQSGIGVIVDSLIGNENINLCDENYINVAKINSLLGGEKLNSLNGFKC